MQDFIKQVKEEVKGLPEKSFELFEEDVVWDWNDGLTPQESVRKIEKSIFDLYAMGI